MRKSLLFLLLPLLGFAPAVTAQIVRIETNLGDIRLRMAPGSAPGTVQNFLRYAADDDYDGSFFHRLVPGFVLQGGGFYPQGAPVPTDDPIVNEFGLSNTRGTVAMARIGGDPDSATSQWFINLGDNSEDLDNQNGGFTVFAEVIEGMGVVDTIAGFQRFNLGTLYEGTAAAGAVGEVPLTDEFINGETPLELVHFVTITDVVRELWADLAFLGGGWVRSDWFGDFTVPYEPWIYHNRHGYIFSTNGTDQGIWLYFPGSGWMWTAEGTYPFLWSDQLGVWIFGFVGGEGAPEEVWYENTVTGELFQLPLN